MSQESIGDGSIESFLNEQLEEGQEEETVFEAARTPKPEAEAVRPTLDLSSGQSQNLLVSLGAIPLPFNPFLPFALGSLASNLQIPSDEPVKEEKEVKKTELEQKPLFPTVMV